ncbi:hypothetical protein C8R43DRAFT_984628 [Mycena crocata]|nr:hypothetical protein C8R43DRAFT_984628 [Mycena crocata]
MRHCEMHQSLRLENLALLPNSLKKLAYAAEKGSLQDLFDLFQLACKLSMGDVHLLPVYHANLNPSNIPSFEDFKTGPDPVPHSVRRAFISLSGLVKLHNRSALRRGALPDLWPRIWAWMLLIDTYWEYDPLLFAPRVRFRLYLDLLDAMCTDSRTVDLINATPDFRSMLWRAFTDIIHLFDAPVYPLLTDVCRMLHIFVEEEDPTHWAELIDGAGGTPDAFAATVVHHITHLVPPRPEVLSPEATFCFSFALRMLEHIQDHAPTLIPVLLSQGIVKATTRAFCALDWVPVPDEVLRACLDRIVGMGSASPDHRWVVESLHAGLLHAISLAIVRNSESLRTVISTLLIDILPAHTVYYTALTEIERMPAKVDAILARIPPAEKATAVNPLLATWDTFRRLADERLQLKRHFDSQPAPSSIQCDDIPCGQISRKTDLRRCSGCRAAFYCSSACQSDDWRHGGHRVVCSRGLKRSPVSCIGRQNRAFLRALLDYEYETQRSVIMRLQTDFVALDPATPFYTLFNFTTGRAVVSVLPLSKLGTHCDASNTAALEASCRAGMELNVVGILRGGEQRHLLFPISSAASRLRLIGGAGTVVDDCSGSGVDRLDHAELLGEKIAEEM